MTTDLKEIILAYISLKKMTFLKLKVTLFFIFASAAFYGYCVNVTHENGNTNFSLIQPQVGIGEIVVFSALLVFLVTLDFILMNGRSKRAVKVITDPNVPHDIKKIFAEDYKNSR